LGTDELTEKLVHGNYLEIRDNKHYLTEKGKSVGGECRTGKFGGIYFVWSGDLNPEIETMKNKLISTEPEIGKINSSELAKKLGITTPELITKLIRHGYLDVRDKKPCLTEKGLAVRGELRVEQSKVVCLWSKKIVLPD
jgi:hypothetical protein